MLRILAKLASHGVLPREALKNNLAPVKRMIRADFVGKARHHGRVFFELTPRALPLLEWQRGRLVSEAQIMGRLNPHSSVYRALLTDVRFLDDKKPEAREFLFLGDWQLGRPVVASQLELAKLRYYGEKVAPRTRKKKAR